MKFSDMGLSVPHNVVLTKVKDQKFTVKQYLPAEDKNAILEIAMQQADQGTILNTFALDAIFHTYIVIKYTNIEFSAEDMQDILKLYDILESNGIIDITIKAIPESEYTNLRTYLLEMVNNYVSYRNSTRALVEQFSFFAPQIAEKLKDVSENFDVNKFKQVVQIADAAGMNNK